jgi:hypothetical protein
MEATTSIYQGNRLTAGISQGSPDYFRIAEGVACPTRPGVLGVSYLYSYISLFRLLVDCPI